MLQISYSHPPACQPILSLLIRLTAFVPNPPCLQAIAMAVGLSVFEPVSSLPFLQTSVHRKHFISTSSPQYQAYRFISLHAILASATVANVSRISIITILQNVTKCIESVASLAVKTPPLRHAPEVCEKLGSGKVETWQTTAFAHQASTTVKVSFEISQFNHVPSHKLLQCANSPSCRLPSLLWMPAFFRP